ncbi:spore coat protein JB [Alicyclobacillus sacchari]|uniref:Spore coat protein JB n=1 Tax=Alicyclobacillus sacchari TaxID=392010 RepID=A0A4R8LTQ7_9BACL|nr:spore coat protein CotJB [Alicyclobacillus sacchari]TDY51110.1 spore coat protein JB [Alicyclobacillus sacchari]GMA56360.1 protein CotJB [Alicyclobacillus sacchari]
MSETPSQMPKAYYQYLHELQSIDFVLCELTLYLDTHPDDEQALAQFTQFQKRKHNLMTQFEAAFGPLYEFGVSPISGNKWTWSQTPWPWQV